MRIWIRILVLVSALTAVAASSALLVAQEPAARTTPVSMVVTVEPLAGKRPAVINREDVRVYQGKQRLEVANWEPATGQRAGLGLFVLKRLTPWAFQVLFLP
jgi:hypothetical protein